MGNLIFSDMFPQSDEWRRLDNMCGSIIYVGTSTSTCFRKRLRLRKWHFKGKKSVDLFPRTNAAIRRIFDINLEQSSHVEAVALITKI